MVSDSGTASRQEAWGGVWIDMTGDMQMSNMDSMERERKKRQLRERMISSSGAPDSSGRRGGQNLSEEEIVRNAERHTRRKRIRLLAAAAVLVIAAAGIFYYYFYVRRYETYRVAWERQVPASEGGFSGYESFGSNVLKYTKDGASYIDSRGKVVWSISYEMKSPICYVNGMYAVIADRQGNDIYICNGEGLRGQAKTTLPIMRTAVSAHGVTAALLEDSTASYITFFKEDGSSLNWGIKTVMSQSGHLMDVSLSPEGTQVMVSNVYLQDSGIGNRIAFYNFSEYGKSYPDRLVGGFEEMKNSLIPRVRFLDENHACAFGNGQIGFFSLENETSPAITAQIPYEEEMRSICYSDRYVGVVVDSAEGEYDYRLDVYSASGKLKFSQPFNFHYRDLVIDSDMVILYNENSCEIYNMSGKCRFSGSFDFTFSAVRAGKMKNELIFTGGDTARSVHLK